MSGAKRVMIMIGSAIAFAAGLAILVWVAIRSRMDRDYAVRIALLSAEKETQDEASRAAEAAEAAWKEDQDAAIAEVFVDPGNLADAFDSLRRRTKRRRTRNARSRTDDN